MRNTIRFDWAIKRLLRNKANFGILEGFLSELLSDDIKINSILESESNRQTAVNKLNRVDLLVQNSKGELIIIEVQSNHMSDYLMRMVFGTSKIIVDNIDEGMPYREVKKVISENVVYFNLGHGLDYIYHGTTNFKGLNKKDTLGLSPQEQAIFNTTLVEKIYPEYYIIKVNQFDNVAETPLAEWINFLKTETVKNDTTARGLKEAKEKLNIMKLSDEERMEYDIYMANDRDLESIKYSNFIAGEMEGIAIGKMEGIAIGKMEGIEIGEANKEKYATERAKQTTLEMAKKAVVKGIAIADIAELTGLGEDEIKSLTTD